jgi:hypothetical protein
MNNLTPNQEFQTNKDTLVASSDELPAFRARRSAGARSAFSRVSDERRSISFGDSQFNLSKNIVDKLRDNGKVLGFVVYSSNNEEQRDNYLKAQDRGWQPLLANEFPELSRRYNLSPFGNKEADEFIKRGGQIAMVRNKEDDDAEKAHYDSEVDRTNKMLKDYSWNGGEVRPVIDHRKRGIK